jgi:II/X family phage/plasmid replication protein
MIDYITVKFPCKHDRSTIPQFGTRYLKIRLRHNSTTMEVKSVENGRYLVASGNPAKYFQGHNIFGSNDLQGLCRDLFAKITADLGISVCRKDQQAINAGWYSISRVDLAANFCLPSQEMVTKVLREIQWHWHELGFNVSNYGDKTVYRDQHSKVATSKFYNKRKEISAHPLPEHILGSQRCMLLKEHAKTLLRAEFTLRSLALKNIGLNMGEGWRIAGTRELLRKKVASQDLHREIKHFALPDEYLELKPELKQIYHLWLHGSDLPSLFERSTLHRRRKSLLIFNIDIKQPPAPYRISTVSLQTLLAPEKIIRLPKFANQLGLIYLPVRKTV